MGIIIPRPAMRGAEANRIAARIADYTRRLSARKAQGMSDEEARAGLLEAVKKDHQHVQQRQTRVKKGPFA